VQIQAEVPRKAASKPSKKSMLIVTWAISGSWTLLNRQLDHAMGKNPTIRAGFCHGVQKWYTEKRTVLISGDHRPHKSIENERDHEENNQKRRRQWLSRLFNLREL
jgi:hypothetical protein